MNPTKVSPLVSQKLGRLLQNRAAVIQVLNRLYAELEGNSERHRRNRDPEDETLFFVPIGYFTNGTWNHLDFSVCDTRAAGFFFVDEVS